MSPATKTIQVYLDRGSRKHVVPAGGVPIGAPCIRCGTRPRPWGKWLGTDRGFRKAAEQKMLRKLPLCERTVRT